MNLAFLDLRVIESSAFIAAPLAGLTLAQFGADVIRVEMIGGGIDYGRLPLMPSGRSLYWTGLNKNKRSIAVDLRRPEGRELVQNLVTAGAGGDDARGGILLTNIVTQWLAHGVLAKARARRHQLHDRGQSGRIDRGRLHGQFARPAIRW